MPHSWREALIGGKGFPFDTRYLESQTALFAIEGATQSA